MTNPTGSLAQGSLTEEVLRRHRAAHDLDKPLVRADYDHALDVWRWVLRLTPGPSTALQVAALFHDIERVRSEADVRVEHHAPDYQAFKDAHARGGAALTRALLEGALEPRTLERACALIERHERASDDPERVALSDADALSFFGLNAPGFLSYYGDAHTRRKFAWTRARLSPRGLGILETLPLREDLRALLREVA